MTGFARNLDIDGRIEPKCRKADQRSRSCVCYCRNCQMISGVAGNLFTAFDAATFKLTSGIRR
jgi:hypothetical protein